MRISDWSSDVCSSDLFGPDDLIVAPHDCYGGTYRLLAARAAKRQFRLSFVDQADAAALDRALAEAPALVLIETPSNPLMRVVDIAEIATRAHAAGAKVVVHNKIGRASRRERVCPYV